MAANDYERRTFVKEVNGEERTRSVYTEADAVNARFDGYEEKTTKSSRSTSGSSTTGSGTKPSGSSSS